MSKNYEHEIGYETLQKDFERYQKQTPRGVGMTKKGQNIYLQFKTPNTPRKQYACGCSFTLDGMVDALKKSNKVSEALKSFASESEFWDWYNKEIKEESQLTNDQITFAEAIALVENDFWSRPDRRKQERDHNNPSDQNSWYRTYGCFYKHLPSDNAVSFKSIEKVINMQKKGTKNYKCVVSAMKKLAEITKKKDILESLNALNVVQTEFADLQSINLEEFLEWREEALGITAPLPDMADLEARKAWLWVFSIQIVYALRISEVFAIKNLTEP